ncbi:hypothetical protein [Rhizobium rhizoryzae]|uniref:hypothetical protein n=1 Tax=Rhizobium rhizoryzae TaxID=451876 RepID=UPI002897CC5B|nr:hypothetical protein [Rhizobium rhizoryzae]
MRYPELYQFRRSVLESYIEKMITLLDEMDGDPDVEANGDELDQSYPEGGQRGLLYPIEDDEDGADHELPFARVGMAP